MTSVTSTLALGKLYKRVLDLIRQWPPVTQQIFGIRIHSKIHRFTWDVTTLVLKKAIDLSIQDGEREVLDMGCGHVALLAQYVKRTKPSNNVFGVDIYEEFARNATENARLNGFAINISQRDLYEGMERRFDYIFSNLPYVPLRTAEGPSPGQLPHPNDAYPLATFSGKEGTDTLTRFLADSHAHLKEGGCILLGINCFHVPEKRVIELIEQCGYSAHSTIKRRFNTARVFVLSQREQPRT